MKIGVTGMIGSGKSTAAQFFKQKYFRIIDADQIGKAVVKSNAQLLDKLTRVFGKEILTPKGNLRRKILAEKAFSTESNREKLNTLVHPYLLKELQSQYDAYVNKNIDFIVDAALLLEWNMEHKFDFVICIHASEATRIKRMFNRGYKKEDVKRIQQRQLTFAEFKRRSDILIYNNTTKSDLNKKLNKVLLKIST